MHAEGDGAAYGYGWWSLVLAADQPRRVRLFLLDFFIMHSDEPPSGERLSNLVAAIIPLDSATQLL